MAITLIKRGWLQWGYSDTTLWFAVGSAGYNGGLNRKTIAKGRHAILVIGYTGAAGVTCSVTDARGNTWTVHQTTGSGGASGVYSAIASCKLAAPLGLNNITVTFSGSVTNRIAMLYEVGGLDPSSWVDQTAGAAGTSTAPSSGSVTTTAANELVIGACCWASGVVTRTSTSPMVEQDNIVADNGSSLAASANIVSSTGTYSDAGTLSSSVAWAESVVTFKAAAGRVQEYIYPGSDIAINSWTTDSGGATNLYQAVDEVSPSEVDYIKSPAGVTPLQHYETKLQTHDDPLSSYDHVLHYKASRLLIGNPAADCRLFALLTQGAPTLSYHKWDGSGSAADNTQRTAFSFVWPGGAINNVSIQANVQTTTTGTLVASIHTDSAGSPSTTVLTTGSIDASELMVDDAPHWIGIDVAPISPAAQTLWVVFTRTGTVSYYGLGVDTTAGNANSVAKFSNSGGAWNVASFDVPYRINGRVIASEVLNYHTDWREQLMALSPAQADAITDYTDLRVVFIGMTGTDEVPTYLADRASANSNSAVTTVDLVLSGLTIGNYLILRTAADNSGTNGAARTLTVTNLSGTVIGSQASQQQNNDPGAASAGVTCNVTVIKIAATSGTIRLTYSGAVVQACVAEEWTGIHPTTSTVGTPVKANSTASTATPTLADASVAVGNAALAVIATEGPSSDNFTEDSDTDGGASWITLTQLGTSIATADLNMTTRASYKNPYVTSAISHAGALDNARDSAGIIYELARDTPKARTMVSWVNFELPQAVVVPTYSDGALVGMSVVPGGELSYGAGDL